MKSLVKLVLKTILITVTVIITLIAVIFGLSVWDALGDIEECNGTTNSSCIIERNI